jgi:Methyltransferase FkbM domain
VLSLRAVNWRQAARWALEPRPGAVRRLPLGPGRGLSLAANPRASLDQWLGLFESELAPHVRRFCRLGISCVDVGGYDGYYSLVFAKLCRAPVFTYEPDGDAYERCRRNVALNLEVGRWIELRAVAVGAAPGPGTVALDEEFFPLPVGLVKVDVDGAEADVLAGAERILATQHPNVIVETHAPGLEVACAEALVRAGYAPRVVTSRRLFPQDRRWPTPQSQIHNRWLVAAA